MKNKIFLLAFAVSTSTAFSQVLATDTANDPYKNSIKWNVTPALLGGFSNIVLSYERMVSKDESFSINAGYLSFPELLSDSADILQNINRTQATGFTLSADYRFYITGRNKYKAPDGLYWGPFVNYYRYDTDFTADYFEGGIYQASGGLNTDINVVYVGAQLGYQFVFYDRWSVDMILFGPALGFYNASFEATGDIKPEGDLKEIIDFLRKQYPVVGDIADFGQGEAAGAGTTWGAGFRYAIKLGYRF